MEIEHVHIHLGRIPVHHRIIRGYFSAPLFSRRSESDELDLNIKAKRLWHRSVQLIQRRVALLNWYHDRIRHCGIRFCSAISRQSIVTVDWQGSLAERYNTNGLSDSSLFTLADVSNHGENLIVALGLSKRLRTERLRMQRSELLERDGVDRNLELLLADRQYIYHARLVACVSKLSTNLNAVFVLDWQRVVMVDLCSTRFDQHQRSAHATSPTHVPQALCPW